MKTNVFIQLLFFTFPTSFFESKRQLTGSSYFISSSTTTILWSMFIDWPKIFQGALMKSTAAHVSFCLWIKCLSQSVARLPSFCPLRLKWLSSWWNLKLGFTHLYLHIPQTYTQLSLRKQHEKGGNAGMEKAGSCWRVLGSKKSDGENGKKVDRQREGRTKMSRKGN